MIGTTVGKYRISEKLGRGGMGTVYKAVDATLDREVAVKVLNPDLTEPDLLKRFRAEAVTLARLNHPGIATLYELHHHDDELVMVMEFVRGETFHDLADRLGPLAPPQAAHLCMQVLDALGHAHRAGVVHRDLKPANLMITEGGTVKVMDFGIARVLGSEHFTHGGYMMGTPAYMAPEQVLGREIDGRADLYSVGVVFYRLLSGQLPFKAETAISMVQKQISDAPTPIATFRPDLPDWCTAVIDRALAKSPSDRFQSAEEFRSALVRAVTPQTLGELPTLSTPTPPGIVLEPDQTMPHGTPVPPLPSTLISTPGVAIQTPATPVASGPVLTPVAVQPTPTAGTERTTTVVLGRTHLAAMAALFVILAAGIAMLAFAALRRGSNQQPITTQASQSVPSVPSQSVSFPPAPAPVPPPAPAEPPASTPPASSAPVPSTNPPTKPLPPAAGGVATVGAVPAPVKPKTMKPGASTDVTTPPTDAAGARGGPAAGANASSPAPPAPATPPPPSAAPTVEQPVIFGQVRVLVTDGGKSREQAGSLRLGDGRVVVLTAGGGSVVSLPISSLTRVVYARSKQPKWRDANGKEVESRIDFGPMGFFRGERNWLMFFAGGEPTILRVEDSALRTVLPAIETHTGLTIQR